MITTKSLCLTTLGIVVALISGLSAQVPTEVPEVVPGATPSCMACTVIPLGPSNGLTKYMCPRP